MMLITVIPYQKNWVDQFRHSAKAIRAALGDDALRIDHIGSTAVEGLSAKPVVDIQITVGNIEVSAELVTTLEGIGYINRPKNAADRPPPWGSQESHEWKKMYFRTPTDVSPRTHVHLREAGRCNQRYALLFRDYLRANERARHSYGLYKQLLGDAVGHLSGPAGTGLYLDLKDPIFDLIADASEKWAGEVDWQPEPSDA